MSLPPKEEAVAAAFHALRAKRKKADNPVVRAVLERIERQGQPSPDHRPKP